MARYYTNIPGNYIQGWLNDFEKKTKENKYTRIEYTIWRDLTCLAKANKVKLVVKSNDESHLINKIIFYYPTTETKKPYLTLTPAENQFAKYLSNWLGGVEDKNQSEIIWHKESDSFNYTYITDGCYMGSDGSIYYAPNNSITSTTSTYTIKTPSVTTYSTITDYDRMNNLEDAVKDILDKIYKSPEENNNIEENNSMTSNNNDMFNFDFGPVSDSKIRMSMYGYAIPNEAGKYVSYDVENERMMDVQILNFNCAGMFYKIPKPISRITYGDVVFHNGVPMFVTDIYEDHTRLIVIDPKDGTEKTILPAHSPFGFDYISCLVSLMDGFDTTADEDKPFGNMLPLILMANGQSSDQTLPLLLMMNNKMDFDNPLMLMMLSGNNSLNINNPLMAMAMMKMFDK